jgi:hypothetical protein
MASWEELLFMPGFGPGIPFRLRGFTGGASRPFVVGGFEGALEAVSSAAAALAGACVESTAELAGDEGEESWVSEGNLRSRLVDN